MRRFAFIALLATACAPVSPIDGAREPIINGSRETGYPEVVAVAWMGAGMGGGLCTGTVIGEYAILTAKHCVFEELASGGHRAVTPAEIFVLVGNDVTTMGGVSEVHYVAEVRTTPGSDIDSDVENGFDIAVLILRARITVPPRATATSGPTPGESATIVGFGRTSTTDSDSAGVKYSGSTRIDRVGMRQLSARGTSGTCQGDSGGPIIDSSGAVTGVTSFGFGSCDTRFPSVFNRVAAFRTLIDDALAYVPPCVPSAEACNGIDDDCDGTIDDGIGCMPQGSPCTDSAECFRGVCEEVGGARICTGVCFPDSPINCAEGMYCQVNACGTGLCAPGSAGTLPSGAACTVDTDCASLYCASLRGGRLCGTPCCPMNEIFCPDGSQVCDLVPGSDGRGACVPEELAMGPRPFGSACAADDECVSARCADPGDFCTQACDAATACPSGYHCESGFCALGELAPTGGPCSTADACRDPGAVCFEGACAGPCTPSASMCPTGFDCTRTPEGDLCLRPGVGLGEDCDDATPCRSGICTTAGCTIICDTITCPSGFACTPAGTVSGCFRTGGGCSAGVLRGAPGSGAAASLTLVAASLLLVAARRRPR